MKIYCEICGLFLGEITGDSLLRKYLPETHEETRVVFLCEPHWDKAKIAMEIAENAQKETPLFLQDLLNSGKWVDKP